MRVLFVQKDFFPHHGLLCLASSARKAGHTCDLAISDIDDMEKVFMRFCPDVVALTLTSGQLTWAKETARSAKRLLGKKTRIIAGGFHPTFFPEIALEGWGDIIVRGEADLSFPVLLSALEQGTPLDSVPNIAYAREGSLHCTPVELPSNLNGLPFPSYDLLTKYGTPEKLGYINLRSSRGCSYDCKFCYAHAIRTLLGLRKDELFRRRNPRSVIAEIHYALNLFPGLGFVKFDDDTFNMPPDSWLEEFAPRYKQEITLPFNCLGRIDLVNEHNAALLKDAGCTAVRFGVESADNSIRNTIYGKGLSENTIRSGVKVLSEQGLASVAINMVGAPCETVEQALDTYRFSLSLGVDCADCLNLYAYPGSPLSAEGRELSYTGDYFYFHPQKRAPREFENLVCLFPTAVALRMPPWMLSILVHAPRNPFYRIILWAGQGIIKLKMKEHRLIHLIRLHVFAQNFFGSNS